MHRKIDHLEPAMMTKGQQRERQERDTRGTRKSRTEWANGIGPANGERQDGGHWRAGVDDEFETVDPIADVTQRPTVRCEIDDASDRPGQDPEHSLREQ